MSEDTKQSLEKAFELIESDEHSRALEIVKPIVEQDPNNADAWWVYIHAVADEDEAQHGLDKLRELDPDYPGVKDIEREIDFAPDDDFGDLDFGDGFDDDFADFDGDNHQFADSKSQNSNDTAGSSRLLRILLPVVAVIAVIIIIALLLSGGSDDDTPEVANEPTTAPTAAEIVTVPDTTEIPTVMPTDDDASELEDGDEVEVIAPVPESTEESNGDALSSPDENDEMAFDPENVLADFELASPTTETVATQIGETLLINICTNPDQEERQTLDDALLMLGETDVIYDENLEAVAVQLQDCEDGNPVNAIGLSLADLLEYAAGELTENEFRAAWQAVQPES